MPFSTAMLSKAWYQLQVAFWSSIETSPLDASAAAAHVSVYRDLQHKFKKNDSYILQLFYFFFFFFFFWVLVA